MAGGHLLGPVTPPEAQAGVWLYEEFMDIVDFEGLGGVARTFPAAGCRRVPPKFLGGHLESVDGTAVREERPHTSW